MSGILDRTQRPPSGQLRPFAFPPFERIRQGDLTLFLARTNRVPMVDLQILLPIGGQSDPLGKGGLAAMHADLLDEGTHRRSAQQIAAGIERLGGALSTGLDWDSSYVHVQSLSKHLSAGMDTLVELVRESDFPEEEIARIRRQRRAEILRRADLPTYLALRRLREMTYGDHPYSRMLIGSPQSLDSIQREDFLAMHERHAGPAGSFFIAVGDFETGALIREVEARLADWPRAEVGPLDPPIQPPAPQGVRIAIVDRPGAKQTELRLGHLGLMRRSPDLAAALVANEVFGGIFTSRINLLLREERGVTYNISSHFSFRRGLGPWVVQSAVETSAVGDAVESIRGEMRRMQEEPATEDEVRNARRYLVGVFPYTVQTIRDLSARLEILAVHDLPDDYYDHYPAVLDQATPESVQQAAQQYFFPDDLRIVVAGPAAELLPQLEKIAPVEVIPSGASTSASSPTD